MPTYTLIMPAVVVGSGGATSIDFASIPSTYTDLVLKLSLRGPTGYASNTMDTYLRFNGTTTNYSDRLLYGTGSAAASLSETLTGINFRVVGQNSTASTFGNAEIYIPNYAGSTNKSVSIDAVTENNATAVLTQLEGGLWSNTAAINQITLVPFTTGFAQYSTAYLYGVSNA
jgi:hypothetical protein